MISCVRFGKQLLDTNDLDPIYVLLYNSQLEGFKLQKWLLAYWCFYDSGTASWILDQDKYWEAMYQAASSKEYPRGTERRHFRGDNATKSVAYLKHWGVRELFEPLLDRCETCTDVMRVIDQWTGFGPWIGFKIADMLECLDLAEINFSPEEVFLFDSPKEGAERLVRSLGKNIPKDEIPRYAVDHLIERLDEYYAPPGYNRGIGVQEAETVLCKWKSHLNGKYQVGEDIVKLKKSLHKFKTPTALALRKVYLKQF